jgi:hypothetical protein
MNHKYVQGIAVKTEKVNKFKCKCEPGEKTGIPNKTRSKVSVSPAFPSSESSGSENISNPTVRISTEY